MKRFSFVLLTVLCLVSLFFSSAAKPVLVETLAHSGIDTAISHRMMDVIVPETGQWEIQGEIEQSSAVTEITSAVMERMMKDVTGKGQWTELDLSEPMDRIILEVCESVQNEPGDPGQFVKELSVSAQNASQAINTMAEGICRWMSSFVFVRAFVFAAQILFSRGFQLALLMVLALILLREYRRNTPEETLRQFSVSMLISALICFLMSILIRKAFTLFSHLFLGRVMTLDLTVFLAGSAIMAVIGLILLIFSMKKGYIKLKTVE